MSPSTFPIDPADARRFAIEVVSRLQGEGHETYWAGGCVRDELLGRTPVDFDVATAATPDEVRSVFGRGRTLAVGAAFGVITVLGPKPAGQVEVATFRADQASSDGRRPAGVVFCSAREDARRRDFTINGMFLDPLTGVVHDFVGGRADLAEGIVRAIGTPALRFREDHLRMLRAVRFTAFFGFVLEENTRAAIESMRQFVAAVSAERVAAELRAMLSRPGRGQAVQLLLDTGLAANILAELAPPAVDGPWWREAARIIDAFDEPDLPMGLAVLAEGAGTAVLARVRARLRLSNREAFAATWLRDGVAAFGSGDPATRPWSQVQPWVVHEHAPSLADVLRARAARGRGDPTAAAWFTRQTTRPRDEIDPPALVSGADLLAAGVPPGRPVGAALARIRSLQLDGLVATKTEALAAATRS